MSSVSPIIWTIAILAASIMVLIHIAIWLIIKRLGAKTTAGHDVKSPVAPTEETR